jgi:hypothetical protein
VQGRNRGEINTAMNEAGWTKAEASAALGAWSETSFIPPIPRPQTMVTARDFFIYALTFGVLIFAASYLVILCHQLIDVAGVRGPAYARMERNDSERLRDLGRLAGSVHCNNEIRVLPDTLEGYGYCGVSTEYSQDPVTDKSYEYLKQDENTFEVCATFELSKVPYTNRYGGLGKLRLAGSRGCLHFKRSRFGGKWKGY